MNAPITLTIEQTRRYDQWAVEKYGVPSIVLMENASRGCCDQLLARGLAGPIVVACGGGNNAGDGFAIARRLDLLGFEVRLLMLKSGDSLKGDAAVNYQIAQNAGLPMTGIEEAASDDEIARHLVGAAWIVDALLGTGATGDPRPPYDRIIRQINHAAAKVFAVDLPSGLNANTGEAGDPTVVADLTCTFVAAKPGLVTDVAQAYVGELTIADIGAPRRLLEEIVRTTP